MEFTIGGLAAVGAGFLTNPLEVLKIRMQLQGELQERGKHVIHYRNILHAGYIITKNEGIISLQKGLVPALWVQFIMNGCRFGFYQYAENRGYLRNAQGNLIFHKNVLVSGIGGVVGHYLSNPFFIVKTHLQSKAAKNIAVGHQHEYEGSLQALKKIFNENGIQGLFRSGFAVVPRAFVASVSQLTFFSYSKQYLMNYEFFKSRNFLSTFIASMIGGTAISIMVTPFDLILTRLYNQQTTLKGKGTLYSGYWDCVSKIYKTEGIYAFFKGIGPMYFRLGPHSVLCLLFWDKLQSTYNNFKVLRPEDKPM